MAIEPFWEMSGTVSWITFLHNYCTMKIYEKQILSDYTIETTSTTVYLFMHARWHIEKYCKIPHYRNLSESITGVAIHIIISMDCYNIIMPCGIVLDILQH